jgi:tetratricopeptide (TPR) repeat protein
MRSLVPALLCALLVLGARSAYGSQAAPPPDKVSARVAELQGLVAADNRAHPTTAVASAEEALGLLATAPDPQAEAWFLLSLTRDLISLDELPKATDVLERGRRLVARTKDERTRLLLEIEAGALLNKMQKYTESRAVLAAALPLAESYHWAHPGDFELALDLGRGYRLLGHSLNTNGNLLEAIQAYQKAQAIARELGDARGQAQVLNKMGDLYTNFGHFEEAKSSQLQAISMAEAIADVVLQARCHISLSDTYGNRHETDLQLQELNRASVLAVKAGDTYLQLVITINLADVQIQRKNFQAVLKYSEAALADPKISQYPSFLAYAQFNRGIALNRLGRHTEGLESMQEGLRNLKATSFQSDRAEGMGNLAEEFAFAGDFRRAYEAYREFKALSDDLKHTKDMKRVAEASAAFEADKKQIQIEALQREKRSQARLMGLWIALCILGFASAGVLVMSRRRIRQAHSDLQELHGRNLTLIGDLQTALTEVKTLQGLIPICAHCKKIRDDQGFWNQMESYIQSRSEATFSHGICPDCAKEVMAEIQHLCPKSRADTSLFE